MSEQINEISKPEAEFANLLTYGYKLVRFVDNETEEKARKMIGIYNRIYPDICEISQAVEDYIDYTDGPNNGQYAERPMDGVFRILWKDRDQIVPALTDDDLMLPEIAEYAKTEKKEVPINISPALGRYAKKVAFDFNVKLRHDGDHMSFDAREKRVSTSKRIQNAYRAGDQKIEISTDEISVATARVYASNLATMTHKKIRVTVEGENVVITFRELPADHRLLAEARKLYETIRTELGPQAADNIFSEIVMDNVTETVVEPANELKPAATKTMPTSEASGHEDDADF